MLPIKHQTRHYNTAIWSLAFSHALGCCSLLVLTVSSDRLFVTFLPCSDWQLWLLSFVWSTLCKTLGRKSECPKIKWWGQRLWDNRACRLSNARPPALRFLCSKPCLTIQRVAAKAKARRRLTVSREKKKLWCCVCGGYYKIIWFYHLYWDSKDNISSVSPSSKRVEELWAVCGSYTERWRYNKKNSFLVTVY